MDLAADPKHGKRPSSPHDVLFKTVGTPATGRHYSTGVYSEMVEARRRSYAPASVRPASLDKFLVTHVEMRCQNVCLHRLPKTDHEMEEKLTALVL